MQAELRPGEELQQRTGDGHEDQEVKAALAESRLQGGGRLQLRRGAHHVAQGGALENVVAWGRVEVVRHSNDAESNDSFFWKSSLHPLAVEGWKFSLCHPAAVWTYLCRRRAARCQ